MKFDVENYITVTERVDKFYTKYPEGRILTAMVEHNDEKGFVVFRAEVYRNADDALPAATGHAYEIRGGSGANQGYHVENCESSAVGRALSNLGFPSQRNPASNGEQQSQRRAPAQSQQSNPGGVTAAQIALLRRSAAEAGVDLEVESQRVYNKHSDELTKKEANDLIDSLKAQPKVV